MNLIFIRLIELLLLSISFKANFSSGQGVLFSGVGDVISGISGIVSNPDTLQTFQTIANSISPTVDRVQSLISGLATRARQLSDTVSQVQGGNTNGLNVFLNAFTRANNSIANFGMSQVQGGNTNGLNVFLNAFTRANNSIANFGIPFLGGSRATLSRILELASGANRIQYFVYGPEDPTVGKALTVTNASRSTSFNDTRETKVFIHEYNQTHQDDLVLELRDAYLNKGEYNVIIVDWGEGHVSYTNAVRLADQVGVSTGRFLKEINANLSTVHVIGFGVGAHAAGITGSELKGKLGRITGLDPSLPLYRMREASQRLDDQDAQFVDVIHTDGGDNLFLANHLGWGDVLGNVDVYVNEGISQPGCPNPVLPSYRDMYCSHVRSLELFIESIQDKNNTLACQCDSLSNFRSTNCDCTSKTTYIGESCPRKARGKFYMLSGNSRPLGKGRVGAFPLTVVQQI